MDTKLAKQINHRSHPTHKLTLLPVTTYSSGQFICNACYRSGNGSSYHCHHCDFDLHVGCAFKPLSIIHQSHAHTLRLSFSYPYETGLFSCNICRKIGSKQWLYRCDDCGFDAHLDCATCTPPPPVAHPPQLLQTHHSFPGAAGQQNQFQTPVAGPMNNYYAHSASTGCLLQPPVPMHQGYTAGGANSTLGSGLMIAVLQGAAQQVGQIMMQSVIGGGGDGDGSSASTFVDSFLGGL